MRSVRTLSCIAAAVVTCVAITACRSQKPARFTSYANLYEIGHAIANYSHDHRGIPQSLSELVPDYVPFDRIGIFYATNKYVRRPVLPSDWTSNPTRIDQFSSYHYLGTNSVDGIICFERLDLWKPSAPLSNEVAVLYQDFRVQYFPSDKLHKRVKESLHDRQ